MNAARRATPAVLWTLQWTLAIAFFLLGLLKAGLPLADLQARLGLAPGAPADGMALAGWLEVAGGLLLVIPSVTAFFPRLTPVAAAYLAVTVLAGAALQGSAAGLGHRWPDLLLGLACAAVALGRGFVDPIAPIDLSPEPEPGRRPVRPATALRVVPAGEAGPDQPAAPRSIPREPRAATRRLVASHRAAG